MILPLAVLVLLIVAGLTGCAGREKALDLDETVRAYESALRWGDLRMAVNFIQPDKRPRAQRMKFELERFEHVRVTGVTPISQVPTQDEDTFIQVVEIRLANRHTAVERVVQDRQVWQYDPELERWWLVSGLPDINRRR